MPRRLTSCGCVPGEPPRPEITVPTLERAIDGRASSSTASRSLHRLDTSTVRGDPDHDGAADAARPRAAPRRRRSSRAHATRRGCSTRRPPALIEECIARNPRKPGAAKLRAALGSDATLSALEDGFLDLLREHGDTGPAHERRSVVATRSIAIGPSARLTVELLSYRFHASRQGFEARCRPAPALGPHRLHLGRRVRARRRGRSPS